MKYDIVMESLNNSNTRREFNDFVKTFKSEFIKRAKKENLHQFMWYKFGKTQIESMADRVFDKNSFRMELVYIRAKETIPEALISENDKSKARELYNKAVRNENTLSKIARDALAIAEEKVDSFDIYPKFEIVKESNITKVAGIPVKTTLYWKALVVRLKFYDND